MTASSCTTRKSNMGTLGDGDGSPAATASNKMGQAYLEHSIAELESQLREARLKTSSNNKVTVCLLDVSMLVYALPVVRKWIRTDEHSELLLPIDALTMLDILKKAEQPICSQAREAIRWLERQLSMPPPHEEGEREEEEKTDKDNKSSHGTYGSSHFRRERRRRSSKLRILGEENMLSWSQVLQKSLILPPRLDDGVDSAETAQAQQVDIARLHNVSLATQASLRALLAISQMGQEHAVVAVATPSSSLASQPPIIKRVLLDQYAPLEDILRIHYPHIHSLTAVLRISTQKVDEVVEAETAFRETQQQARIEQREQHYTASQHRANQRYNKPDRRQTRPDSGYQQEQRARNSRSSHRHQQYHLERSSEDGSPVQSNGARNSSSTTSSSTSTLWNEPPPARLTPHGQPKILQKKASPVIQQMKPKAVATEVHYNTASPTKAAPARQAPHIGLTCNSTDPQREIKSTPAPKIMLANPKITARSLSTAT